MNRREFLAGAAALSLKPPVGITPAAAGPNAEVLAEFDYGEVELTGGPLKAQYDRIRASYLALDNDSLLKVYREHAGLPAPGAAMGGWYAGDGFVPGHSLGQYISGIARIGRTTGDAACVHKVGDLVEGFAVTMGPKNLIYAGSNAEKVWPCYILDKHLAGLIDAWKLCGVARAREILPRVFEGALPFIPKRGRDRVGKKDPPYDETYVLPENLFEVYALTGDRAFFDRAVAFLLDEEFFDPLAKGIDVLPGRHAYSHVMALSSAAKGRLVLGKDSYLETMSNAYRFLALTQQYASGGWGPNETFIEPHRGLLYASLHTTEDHFETPCGSYAAIKLARYLLRATGDARYGDGLERVLFNGLLGVKDPDKDGDYPYYSTYGAVAEKVFYSRKWPCCSGTLIQGVADYVKNVYFRSTDGVTVILYTPSIAHWTDGMNRLRLVQETNYPLEGNVRFRVECAEPVEFTLQLRVPGWLHERPTIEVNAEVVKADIRRGFVRIRRTWTHGDAVTVEFKQTFRTEEIDDLHPDTVAALRGPLLYVLQNPEESRSSLPDLAALASENGKPGVYNVVSGGKSKLLLPFYLIRDERYTTYFENV